MTTSSIIPFEFDHNPIRALKDEKGEPWFVAADVCAVLDLGNSRQVLARLDADQKGSIIIETQTFLTISEPGLYELLFTSRKPGVKALKKWLIDKIIRNVGFTFEELFAILPPRTEQQKRKHREKKQEARRRRRAHISAVVTDVTSERIAYLKARSRGICYWCGKKARIIHIDHITPLSKGGEHMMYNLCVSCPSCNCSKGDNDPQAWGVLF